MPKLFEFFGYKFFFWSNEFISEDILEPVHIHVDKEQHRNAPKIWINYDGRYSWDDDYDYIKPADKKKIEAIIEKNFDYIISEWEKYFDTQATYNSKVFLKNYE